MKTYFVCRSQYEIPLGHRIVGFPSPSLLDWFQDNWISPELRNWLFDPPAEGAFVPTHKPESKWTDEDVIPIHNYDSAHQHTEKVLNGGVYGFIAVWKAMAKWSGQPPQNAEELKRFISTIDYPEGQITFRDHALQCLTDDDEIEIAWYLFDEEFAKHHPERVAFLLHPTWQLDQKAGTETAIPATDPSRDLSGSGDPPDNGVVYCVFLSALDGMTLLDITGAYRFTGVRLPQFAGFIRSRDVPLEKKTRLHSLKPTWPEELILIRALAHSSKAEGFAEFLAEVGDEELNDKAAPARAMSDLRYSIKKPKFLTGSAKSCWEDFERLQSYIAESRKGNRTVWVREMLPPRIQTSDHFCQIRFHERLNPEQGRNYEPVNYTWSYLFFDDHWIASHSDLAQSILHYAAGWQALYKAEPIVSR